MAIQGQENQTAFTQANIVFEGTVIRTSATSFAEAPQSDQTMIVRVDSVLKKPDGVSLSKDDNVTVETKAPSDFREGVRAIFYTEVWIFGSGIAVKEVAHEAPNSAVSSSTAKAGQMQENLINQKLREKFDSADAVIVGRVMDVHSWTPPVSVPAPHHVSEHDPNWQEAVIQVDSALKDAKSQNMVVRFPGSLDVAWAGSHKFTKGEQGTFFLRKDQATGSPTAIMNGLRVDAYTALKEGDVLPAADAQRVREIMPK